MTANGSLDQLCRLFCFEPTLPEPMGSLQWLRILSRFARNTDNATRLVGPIRIPFVSSKRVRWFRPSGSGNTRRRLRRLRRTAIFRNGVLTLPARPATHADRAFFMEMRHGSLCEKAILNPEFCGSSDAHRFGEIATTATLNLFSRTYVVSFRVRRDRSSSSRNLALIRARKPHRTLCRLRPKLPRLVRSMSDFLTNERNQTFPVDSNTVGAKVNRMNSGVVTDSFGHHPMFSRNARSTNVRIHRRASIVCFALLLALATIRPAMGQTINVGSSVDLNNAILTIDSHPNNGYTLNLINGFTMGQQVPGINPAIPRGSPFRGNSNTIDGANLYQPLTLNSGTVTMQNLTIANTSQPITVNGGTLIGTTSSLQGAITNNAAVQFKNTTTSDTYGGNMSGTKVMSRSAGTGIVTFSGLNAYTGGTTVDSGSQLTGTTDSLQGPINNNWLVQFNQAVNGTYAGDISGTGGVEISGCGGNSTFSGTNSYSDGNSDRPQNQHALIGTTSSLQGTFFNAGIGAIQPKHEWHLRGEYGGGKVPSRSAVAAR